MGTILKYAPCDQQCGSSELVSIQLLSKALIEQIQTTRVTSASSVDETMTAKSLALILTFGILSFVAVFSFLIQTIRIRAIRPRILKIHATPNNEIP